MTPKVVLDTSTLIGALLKPRSAPALALARAWDVADLIVSDATLQELEIVLLRDRLDRFRDRATRLAFLQTYRDMTCRHEVTCVIQACRDPQDDKFLSLAVSARAQVIVSSDDDLLSMHPFGQVSIVSARQFLNLLGDTEDEEST